MCLHEIPASLSFFLSKKPYGSFGVKEDEKVSYTSHFLNVLFSQEIYAFQRYRQDKKENRIFYARLFLGINKSEGEKDEEKAKGTQKESREKKT